MNIRQMRSLLAIVETGSFAAAGDQVGLSHSAISLQIKALEEELGVQLFNRSQRPPVPTLRGRALAEHARKTLALFDATAAIASGDAVRGQLVVGAVPTALASFVPAALGRLRLAHPDLRIDLRSGGSADLAGLLAKGQLDVAICTRPEHPMPALDWHLIAEEPFVVIAPADCAGQSDTALLAGQPFIWFNRKTWAGRGIETQLHARKITVQATMEIDALDAIAPLVREGMGVSIVPVCKGTAPDWEGLYAVPFGDPPYMREIGALVPKGGAQDALIEAFLRVLGGDD